MALVEADGIARVQAPHDAGERAALGLHHEVTMVGHERPPEATSSALREDASDAIDEILSVVDVEEELLAPERMDHHMMREGRPIEADAARHDASAGPGSSGSMSRPPGTRTRPTVSCPRGES
jgi:hypothetical protein